MFETPHLTDAEMLRTRIREHVDSGVLTLGYRAGRDAILALLNDALATAIVGLLRYERYQTLTRESVPGGHSDQFVVRAHVLQTQVDQLAQRIVELGGAPDLFPEQLASRGHAWIPIGKSFVDLVKDDMIAQCIALDSYKHIVEYLNDRDPTTDRMMSAIVAAEEKYTASVAARLEAMPP